MISISSESRGTIKLHSCPGYAHWKTKEDVLVKYFQTLVLDFNSTPFVLVPLSSLMCILNRMDEFPYPKSRNRTWLILEALVQCTAFAPYFRFVSPPLHPTWDLPRSLCTLLEIFLAPLHPTWDLSRPPCTLLEICLAPLAPYLGFCSASSLKLLENSRTRVFVE